MNKNRTFFMIVCILSIRCFSMEIAHTDEQDSRGAYHQVDTDDIDDIQRLSATELFAIPKKYAQARRKQVGRIFDNISPIFTGVLVGLAFIGSAAWFLIEGDHRDCYVDHLTEEDQSDFSGNTPTDYINFLLNCCGKGKGC